MARLPILAAAAMLLAGCVAAYPAPVVVAPVQVPPGHMPPPGECRIWYPDRPPGHQPPPGPCGVLQFQVPLGAYLIRG